MAESAGTGGGDGFLSGEVFLPDSLRPRDGIDRLAGHLEARYGISVSGVAELDLGVMRVDRHDGPSWVARVFPRTRPVEAAEGDARILQALERRDFPAERCAVPEPVSVHEGQPVLVTVLVDGERATGRGRTFAVLGALLGALHAATVEARTSIRPGGAWHHIAPEGGPRQEIGAAVALLDALSERVTAREVAPLAAMREAVQAVDDCEDLPAALLHPDFVPANAISTPEGGLVMVDWTGAGRGPRLWALGFLLWAAGARDLRLVDSVVTHYRRRLRPEPAELARLDAAIGARPLVFACWNAAAGHRSPAELAEEIGPTARLAAAIGARARAGFEEPAGANDDGERSAEDGAPGRAAPPR